MWYMYVIVGVVCIFLGWIFRGIVLSKPPIGTIDMVEWQDGTYDLLLQLDHELTSLSNGEEVNVKIRRTRR